MIIKCDYCGKEFNRDLHEVKKRKNHYCSQKCYGLARRTRKLVKCETCGKEFEKANFFYNKNKHHFCSYECRYKSQYKENNIIIKENYAEIIVNSPKYGEKIILIDIEDIDKINKFKWAIKCNKNDNYFYAQSQQRGIDRKTRKSIKLHRYIMNCPDDMVVDHINHNTLDNRKSNLRIVSKCINSQNQLLSKANKTGYKYICFHKRSQKYRVSINRFRKYIQIGSFKTLEEAVRARDEYIASLNDDIESMMIKDC